MKETGDNSVLSSRLRELRNALGLNIAEFSRALGVPRSTLVGWEDGKAVSIAILAQLKAQFSVNIDWFLTGHGEMFIKLDTVSNLKTETVSDFKSDTVSDLPHEKEETEQKPHGAVFEPEQPSASEAKSPVVPYSLQGRKGFQVLSPRHLRQPRNLELYKYKRGKGEPVSTQISTVDPEAVAFIPVFGQRAAAGPGQEPTQLAETEGLVPIVYDLFGLHRPESCGIVQVVGDSMSDISLFNGDWCVFDRVDIQGDGVFVISMFGEMRVKRLQYRLSDRKIIIASENKKRYPEPEVISAEVASSGQLIIHGRVFAWFHKHPY